MADGGKQATLITTGGVPVPVLIYVNRDTVIVPAGYDNVKAEQRLTVIAQLRDLPGRVPAPPRSIFQVGDTRYIVDDDDTTTVVDANTATHVVRIDNG